MFGYGNSGSMTETMRIKGNGDVALLGKHALRASDTWLRLNQDGAFSSACTRRVFSAHVAQRWRGSWGNPGDGNVWITGNVGIGTTAPVSRLDIFQAPRTDPGNHPKAVKGLYLTGDFGSASDGVEFRHSNGSQGIGFGFNSIYAAGNNANQDLNLMPKGTARSASERARRRKNWTCRVISNSTTLFPPRRACTLRVKSFFICYTSRA